MSLWQKPEQEANRMPSTSSSSPSAASPSGALNVPSSAHTDNRSMGKPATIGQSVQINGELTGQEDLIIDGRIQGKIVVKGHNLTIGPNGRIDAEVHAKSVVINGQVTGNITADDKVEISPSGSVQGDIAAPRVALADGSSFKGAIDMGRKPEPIGKESAASMHRDMNRELAATGSKG